MPGRPPEGFPDLSGRPWLVVAVTAVFTGGTAGTLALLPIALLQSRRLVDLVQALLLTALLVFALPAALRVLDGWMGPIRPALVGLGAALGYLLLPSAWSGSAFWSAVVLPRGVLTSVLDLVLWVAVAVLAWRRNVQRGAEPAISQETSRH